MVFDFFREQKRNDSLIASILDNDIQNVEWLLSTKVNPNAVSKGVNQWEASKEVTPLLAAVGNPKGPRPDIVQALLAHGADPNIIIKTQVKSGNYTHIWQLYPFQSVLLINVLKAANASDPISRAIHSEIYCALRAAGADMYCAPSKHEHKGDMAFANVDYLEWDLSINKILANGNTKRVWEDMEQTFQSYQQKQRLTHAVVQERESKDNAVSARRLKI